MDNTYDKLIKRILVLNDRVWEQRMPKSKIEEWLSNFTGKVAEIEVERIHALFWLSQFMYFGSREIRGLLRAMYRDIFLTPLLQEIQAKSGPALSDEELHAAVKQELLNTRFFGVGNPSESGVHLLYYYRQENGLDKDQFMDAVSIFTRSSKSTPRSLRNPAVSRYVFLDDICGSGDTALTYSQNIIDDLLDLNPQAQVAYHSLFASQSGLATVRATTRFGSQASAVYELDPSYKCLSEDSRFFGASEYPDIDRDIAVRIATEYGLLVCDSLHWQKAHACGYKNSQMLMGFHHNTPDNTLPIIWYDSASDQHNGSLDWSPAFKRYPKIVSGI